MADAREEEKTSPEERPDPLIDEVRDLKRFVSEQFGNDVRKLGEHLKEMQEQFGSQLVREVPDRKYPDES